MNGFERLCAVTELGPGEARRYDVAGHRIALVRVGDDFYAIGDRCSHANFSLAEGEVISEDLEIETNDVRCSHASAVGPIDEEQRFYVESRGVPPGEAERLIVTGFFEEVLARVPVPGMVPHLRARIAAKLDARDG